MRATLTFLNFFFIISHLFLSANSYHELAPALYVFGDSLVDSGNNNILPTVAKADFSPYGSSFAGGPTGRFTNGRTVADFFAEYLRLPYPPPYLSLRETVVPTGLNYASGSCGILLETGSDLGKCLSLYDQVNLFQSTIEVRLARYYGTSTALSDYLSKSIFVISIGSNDYINNYLLPRIYPSSRLYSAQSFAKILVNLLSQQLQRLYQLGARKVIVFEIGPIGCIPSVTKQYSHVGKCVEEINRLAVIFNNKLTIMLNSLNYNLKGSKFIHGHIINLAYDALINPFRYGLVDSSNPCCTTWGNGTLTCIPWIVPCQNPERHYFWDGVHLTESAYSLIAKNCINNRNICTPMNIRELVMV